MPHWLTGTAADQGLELRTWWHADSLSLTISNFLQGVGLISPWSFMLRDVALCCSRATAHSFMKREEKRFFSGSFFRWFLGGTLILARVTGLSLDQILWPWHLVQWLALSGLYSIFVVRVLGFLAGIRWCGRNWNGSSGQKQHPTQPKTYSSQIWVCSRIQKRSPIPCHSLWEVISFINRCSHWHPQCFYGHQFCFHGLRAYLERTSPFLFPTLYSNNRHFTLALLAPKFWATENEMRRLISKDNRRSHTRWHRQEWRGCHLSIHHDHQSWKYV